MSNQFPWLNKLLGSVLAILVMYFVVLLVRRIVKKTIADPTARYRTNKRVFYTSVFVTVIIIAMIWAESIGSITTMLGLLSAGLALALKDPISSLVGWMFITGAKLYQLGDRIEMNEIKGDVIDISIMTTTIVEIGNWVMGEQSTGRIVRFPNNWIFSQGIFNYTQAFPFVWTEVAFVVTFESNWRKASEILTQAMNEVVGDLPQKMEASMEKAKDYFLIHYRKYTPIVYINIVDSGVKLVGRFLVQVRSRRGKESELTKVVLEKFDAEEDISLAYTTFRVVK